MSPLHARHFDAIRMAREIVEAEHRANVAGEPPYEDHRSTRANSKERDGLIRWNGLKIARALLDAIEELEKPK